MLLSTMEQYATTFPLPAQQKQSMSTMYMLMCMCVCFGLFGSMKGLKYVLFVFIWNIRSIITHSWQRPQHSAISYGPFSWRCSKNIFSYWTMYNNLVQGHRILTSQENYPLPHHNVTWIWIHSCLLAHVVIAKNHTWLLGMIFDETIEA
jgi:hypothetical protein